MDVRKELMNKELCVIQLDGVIEDIQRIHRGSSINKFEMLLLALIYAKELVEKEGKDNDNSRASRE